ncbi:MAG: CPBP family intramembrane metalloprotease [Acidobacteriota bacterium]|nr:CPBP family intramembrane metalloprotease [Acidobacteriota bacterium]
MTIVFAEELWRAVCLKTLVSSGNSTAQALVVISIVYGLTFLIWSPTVAVSECALGLVLGAMFFWSGSLLVPFAAHATLKGFLLLVAVADSPEVSADGARRKQFVGCPCCRKSLEFRQVNFNPNEAFRCPFCNARITISDGRRWVARWGFTFVMFALMAGFWSMLPGDPTANGGQFILLLLLTVCAGVGLWNLVDMVFPPRLEYGDPDFVGLNLGDRNRAAPGKENAAMPGGPDSDDDDSRTAPS